MSVEYALPSLFSTAVLKTQEQAVSWLLGLLTAVGCTVAQTYDDGALMVDTSIQGLPRKISVRVGTLPDLPISIFRNGNKSIELQFMSFDEERKSQRIPIWIGGQTECAYICPGQLWMSKYQTANYKTGGNDLGVAVQSGIPYVNLPGLTTCPDPDALVTEAWYAVSDLCYVDEAESWSVAEGSPTFRETWKPQSAVSYTVCWNGDLEWRAGGRLYGGWGNITLEDAVMRSPRFVPWCANYAYQYIGAEAPMLRPVDIGSHPACGYDPLLAWGVRRVADLAPIPGVERGGLFNARWATVPNELYTSRMIQRSMNPLDRSLTDLGDAIFPGDPMPILGRCYSYSEMGALYFWVSGAGGLRAWGYVS